MSYSACGKPGAIQTGTIKLVNGMIMLIESDRIFGCIVPACQNLVKAVVFQHKKALNFVPFSFIEPDGGWIVIVFQKQFPEAFCNHFDCHGQCTLLFLMVTE